MEQLERGIYERLNLKQQQDDDWQFDHEVLYTF